MPRYDRRKRKDKIEQEPQAKKSAPFWRELRILVAVQLYVSGQLSSVRAAKLAGVNHVEFLLNLGFYKVFPLADELTELERTHE